MNRYPPAGLSTEAAAKILAEERKREGNGSALGPEDEAFICKAEDRALGSAVGDAQPCDDLAHRCRLAISRHCLQKPPFEGRGARQSCVEERSIQGVEYQRPLTLIVVCRDRSRPGSSVPEGCAEELDKKWISRCVPDHHLAHGRFEAALGCGQRSTEGIHVLGWPKPFQLLGLEHALAITLRKSQILGEG